MLAVRYWPSWLWGGVLALVAPRATALRANFVRHQVADDCQVKLFDMQLRLSDEQAERHAAQVVADHMRANAKDWQERYDESVQATKIALAQLEVAQVTIAGLIKTCEKHEQRLEAEARIYARKAQPHEHLDPGLLSGDVSP